MPNSPLNRRLFTKTLATGALAGVHARAGEAAASASTKNDRENPQDPRQSAAEPDPSQEPSTPEPALESHEDLILQLVKIHYPDDQRLQAEQLAEIRRQAEGILARSRALASHVLANSDEPAPIFTAFRADEP